MFSIEESQAYLIQSYNLFSISHQLQHHITRTAMVSGKKKLYPEYLQAHLWPCWYHVPVWHGELGAIFDQKKRKHGSGGKKERGLK